jgi:hypothetical protein
MYNRLRMRLEQPHVRRALLLATICVLLIGVSGLSLLLLRTQQSAALGLEGLTLPGQQRWIQGGVPVSSYLFGTTDLARETITPNIETSPGVQAMLKSAGITLIRTDFPDNATDAQILARLQTVSQAGASCLGTIANPANIPFDLHLVKLAAPRGCLMWEIGLAPDASGVAAETYLAQWKALVPQLRAATTATPIKVMGPATASENHAYIDAFLQGARAANALPDALSYHWFPCLRLAQAACMAQASSVTQTVQDAQALLRQDLGMQLPVAITAWNAQLSQTPSPYVSDPAFIAPFTATALSAMGLAGVAIANQVAAASGAGGGALDMIGVTPRIQPKAQFITMLALILADRPPCGTPVATMSPTTVTGTPSASPTTGTAVATISPTLAVGTPSASPTTTPQASPSATPSATVTPCPPCPSPTGTAMTTPTGIASPSATASATSTPLPGTPTPTPCPPTPCPSPTASASPTGTPPPSVTATGTVATATPTITASPSPLPTGTPCLTPTGTTAFTGGIVRSFAAALAQPTGNEELP